LKASTYPVKWSGTGPVGKLGAFILRPTGWLYHIKPAPAGLLPTEGGCGIRR